MFITAFLIAIVWTWFQYGVGAAVVLSLLGFVLFSACLRWRSLWFIALSVWVLASLEVNVGHVLTKEHQHEVYPLTVCVSQSPKIFSDDYTSAYASVVNQPDFLNLRHIKISLNSAVSTTIPALESGDCLEGDVRLRQPFGRIVPGSFNVDRYNFAHQIDAFGSFVVVRNVTNTPSFAQKLFLKRYHAFEKSNARDIWAALALGWSYSMSSDLKSTLAANQIMHIFVVSGMHLAFIGLFVGLFVQWIAFLISRFVIVSYKAKMAVVVTLLFFYVALIGFPIPAVRSLIMMLIPFLVFWFGVKLRWYRSLAIAALIITLWHPESWLSIGPWLSFSSVGLILLVNHWQLIHKVKWLFSILIFQFIMSLSILPWAFLGGFQVNLLSFFINLILTPLVTIVGLPVVALISMTTWQWPVQLLENGVSYLTGWLARFADFGFQLHYFHPSLVITVILFALYFFWRRQIVSYIPLLVGMFVFLISFFMNSIKPPEFVDQITFFDVGHGQSVLFTTKDNNVLYDTGGRFTDDISLLEANLSRILPSIDVVVVSHSDADHSSGFQDLLHMQPHIRSWTGQQGEYSGQHSLTNCHKFAFSYPQFRFLPIPSLLQVSDNDHSCIMLFQSGQHSLLITGDASRMIEYYLIQNYLEIMPFDVVLLGHHGSDSSSANDWLELNKQSIFVLSSGDRAAPRWPSNRILQWFRTNNIRPFNTATLGTIRLTMETNRIDIKTWDSAYRIRLIN